MVTLVSYDMIESQHKNKIHHKRKHVNTLWCVNIYGVNAVGVVVVVVDAWL